MENLNPHLAPLRSEQLEGFAKFEKFWYSDQKLAVLAGLGGTGKTFSIAKYCLAVGLHPTEVVGVAPTNTAADNLGAAMAESGFPCAAMTCHKLLGMAPRKIDWNSEKDQELQRLDAQIKAWDASEDYDPSEFKASQAILSRLTKELKAVRDKKLIFAPVDGFEPDKSIRLYIIDESSMIGEEIFELIVTYLCDDSKVLFMGDSNQLFPIGEGLSKTFEVPHIATFRDVQRSAGTIARLSKAIVDCQNLNTAIAILDDLPEWSELCDSPENLPEHEAAIINKRDTKRLFWTWEKQGLERDGLAYRALCYKNESVDRINNASLLFGSYDRPPIGSKVIANSPVSRWAFDVKPEPRLLQTSELRTVLDHGDPIRSYAPGFGWFTVHPLMVETPNVENRIKVFQRNGHPLDKGRSELISQISWLYWTNDPLYFQALDFWNNVRRSLFCKGTPPRPNENENIAQLFEWLQIDSWTNFVGTPGLKTHKQPSNDFCFDWLTAHGDPSKVRAFFTDLKLGTDVSYPKFRKKIEYLALWLEHSAVDPIKPVAASTVHKSQGATIDRVVVNLPEIIESRKYGKNAVENCYRAIYTAVSRAKLQLFLMV